MRRSCAGPRATTRTSPTAGCSPSRPRRGTAYLNDINGGHVTEDVAIAALEAAASGPVEEGSVGGGTGMNCYDFKGGSGTAAGPICLTNTHAVGIAHPAIVRWTARHHPQVADGWLLPVATETWDGYLNDINGGHVTEDVAIAALEAAASGPVEEGSVGGGTGMNCYDFKGGSGTASRIVGFAGEDYAVGVFVQANFGDRRELVVAGVPVGEALADDDPIGDFYAPPGAGSIVAIVATDAPLLPQQCAALARRVTTGIARTGTAGSHFSGDLFLALSTGNPGAFTPGYETFQHTGSDELAALRFVPWGAMDPYFTAVVQATEEAILDAIVANEAMIGYQGHRSPALPRDRLAALLDDRLVR